MPSTCSTGGIPVAPGILPAGTVGHSGRRARHDRVYGDSIFLQRVRARVSQSQDSRLGRRVVGLAGAAERGVRREIDYPAVFAFAHMRGRRTHRAVVPLQMHFDHVVPFLLGHVEDHAIAQDAGDVDEDIEFSEFLDRLVDEGLAAFDGCDIHMIGTAFPPLALISLATSSEGDAVSFRPATVTPRSLITTAHPCAANALAMPRPIPRPPPVIAATLPSSLPIAEKSPLRNPNGCFGS